MTLEEKLETLEERDAEKEFTLPCNEIESSGDTTRLTDKQAGEMLGKHEKTVGIWRRDGRLGVTIGSRRVIRVCDVEDFIRKVKRRT